MAESPTVRRRDLGARLRQYRDRKGLSREDVSAVVDRDPSWVSRLELGRTGVRADTLAVLFDLYAVDGHEERQELLALARGGRQRGWWSRYARVVRSSYRSYIGFESSATRLRAYEGLVPHGLLQTKDYAELLLATGSPSEDATQRAQKVEVRLARQHRLLDDHPLELLTVMDEAVLHRVIAGNIAVHRGQLEHLLALAGPDYPNVRIQVIPFAHSVFPSQLASFTILEFDGKPDVTYIELLNSDIYEEPPESDDYRLKFDDLRAAALADTASIDLIEKVLSGLAST